MKSTLGDAMNSLSHDELDEIGRIFTFYKNDTKIVEALEKTDIDKGLYPALLNLPSFSKTGHISVKACKLLIPFLEEGKTYNEACECAGLDFKAHSNAEKQMLLPPKSYELDDIVNPVVRRAVSQTVKVVNAIIREMGTSPTYLNIELARELSKSKKERDEIEKNYLLNRAKNEKIKKEIVDNFGFEPKGQDIVKLKLYHEQDGICPYSLKSIEYISDNCPVPEIVFNILMAIATLISPSTAQAVPCLINIENAGINILSSFPAMPFANPS